MPAVEGRRVAAVPWFIYLAGVMGILGVVVGVAVGVYLIRKYRERRWGWCSSKRRLEGKVVVVTGANSGIGKEAARDLASRGAVVVMACRNKEAALEAVRDIRTTTADGELIVMELDLGELASVRTFATSLLSKFDRLDVLVNNAGVYVPPEERAKTKDGIEIHFGVNHLGPFLLTNLLLPRLQTTAGSRIVTVASSLYKSGKINFDNLEGEKGWDRSVRNALYSNSKLANVMHSQELSRRTAGTHIRAFALCPGFVSTGLFRHSAHKLGFLRKVLLAPVLFFFMRNARQGAQSTIFCAVSEELDDKEWTMVVNCKPAPVGKVAEDPATAERLWEVSLEMVGEAGRTGEAAGGRSRVLATEEQQVRKEEDNVKVEDLLGLGATTEATAEVAGPTEGLAKAEESKGSTVGSIEAQNKTGKSADLRAGVANSAEAASESEVPNTEAKQNLEISTKAQPVEERVVEVQGKADKVPAVLLGVEEVSEVQAEKSKPVEVETGVGKPSSAENRPKETVARTEKTVAGIADRGRVEEDEEDEEEETAVVNGRPRVVNQTNTQTTDESEEEEEDEDENEEDEDEEEDEEEEEEAESEENEVMDDKQELIKHSPKLLQK